jgi:predicted GNAT superfamily acetyltransferase
MSDELNENVPSDRLIVEWHLNSERVIDHLTDPKQRQYPSQVPSSHVLNQTKTDKSGLARPVDIETGINSLTLEGANRAYVEILPNYQELRQRDMDLVLKWRLAVRDLLEPCFSRGMSIRGFIFAEGRSFYVLDKVIQ